MSLIDIGIDSVEDYWREILTPNVQDFVRDKTPRTIFNAALATWHVHDWAWNEGAGRAPGLTRKAYGREVQRACPKLGLLRDLGEAAKHKDLGRTQPPVEVDSMRLGRRVGYFASGYHASDFYGAEHFGGRRTQIVTHAGGSRFEAIEDIMKKAVEWWRTDELKSKNLPSPY